MYCKNCGKELPDESLFCGYCGANLEESGSPAGFAREQAAKIKEKTPNVTKEDFMPLTQALKNPFDSTEIGKTGLIVSAVVSLIGCWISFGFRYGILGFLTLWLATMIILNIAEKGSFDFSKALSQIAQVLFVPALFLIISGIFAFFGSNPFVIMLRLFLLGVAVMVYIYSMETYISGMSKWAKVLIMAALFAILAACTFSSLSWALVSGAVKPY